MGLTSKEKYYIKTKGELDKYYTLKEIRINAHKPLPYWFRFIMIFSIRIVWVLVNVPKWFENLAKKQEEYLENE